VSWARGPGRRVGSAQRRGGSLRRSLAVEVSRVVSGGSWLRRGRGGRGGVWGARNGEEVRCDFPRSHDFGYSLRGSWRDPRVMSLRTSSPLRAATASRQAFEGLGADGFVRATAAGRPPLAPGLFAGHGLTHPSWLLVPGPFRPRPPVPATSLSRWKLAAPRARGRVALLARAVRLRRTAVVGLERSGVSRGPAFVTSWRCLQGQCASGALQSQARSEAASAAEP